MSSCNGKPGISVVIPAFNAERYIRATIESVFAQTHPVQEIIVVDDGSTDSTPDILTSLGGRIRTIRQLNQGLSAARNYGIAAASGKWLAFLDADDLWSPDFCSVMLAAANSSPAAIGVITCGWQYIDTDDNKIGDSALPAHDEITFQHLLMGNRFPAIAAIVHRVWVNKVGGFTSELKGFEDWDFWLRLAHAGCEFQAIPHVLVSYRQVPGSMSRQVQVMRDNGMAVLDKIYARPGLSRAAIALRETAYGQVRLWAGANHYEVGCPNKGFEEICQALIEFPSLLAERETYHTIICAQQPREYKGTTMNLDLVVAETRLQAVLDAVTRSDNPPSRQLRRLADLLAHQTLADYFFRQGCRRQALRHAMHSFRYAADSSSAKQGTRLFAKAIVRPIPVIKVGE